MQDPGATRECLEIRYPFFDKRLLEFLVGIPPMPWCVEKNILRTCMRGHLPEEVRRRPKTPLVSDGFAERRSEIAAKLDNWTPIRELAEFVDLACFRADTVAPFDGQWHTLQVLSLNWWLSHFRRLPLVLGGVA